MIIAKPETPVTKGEVVCWIANEADFLKFLTINYLLHAITILSSPGDGVLLGVFNKLIGLSMPLCGVGRAIKIIYRFAHSGKTPLDTALRAGALCMVARGTDQVTFLDQVKDLFWCCVSIPLNVLAFVFRYPSIKPKPRPTSESVGRPISTAVKIIHGQYPVKDDGIFGMLKKFIYQPPSPENYLVIVPPNFKVNPPLLDGGPLTMSYNYSMVKAFAAIGQILYGSFQLYKSAAGNIAYYGYEAYELTIIPYIVMSFLNLVASLCEPQFPAIFLVDREPDIRTAVTPNTSAVVGIIPLNSPTKARSIFNIRAEQSPVRAYFAVVACTILAVGSITTPYLVIWSMTKFKAGTRQQKEPPALFASWVMLWLVNGQIYSLLILLPSLNSNPRPAFRLFRTLLFIFGAFYGVTWAIVVFYFVAATMVGDVICTII